MHNTGTLIANDRDLGRIQALRQSLLRMGLVNTTITCYDGVNYPKDAGYFDRILVDAPCSCEGTIRKNPEVAHRLSRGKLDAMAHIQRLLLEKAVQLCKVGGRIVYSTCTFAPEENEGVVDSVLRKFGAQNLKSIPAKIPEFKTCPGLTRWENQDYHESVQNAVRIWPHHNDTGGFFIAVLKKTGEAGSPRAKERKQHATLSGMRPDEIHQKTKDIPKWINVIAERFGIEESELESYQIFSEKRERVSFTSDNHTLPLAPEINTTGLPLMRAHALYPKLTTPAVQLIGSLAKQNVIQLKRDQIESFMKRENLQIESEQMIRVTETGYVIVKYEENPLGVGFMKTGNKPPYRMESLFPKAWYLSTLSD